MDLAVVILCWRNREHLPELLHSIAAQRTTSSFEVVVCHNEPDPGAQAMRLAAPEGMVLREIFTGANLGYAGGNNFAIASIRKRAEPRYFLILNSDVVLLEGALQAVIDWADGHPAVAVTGAVQQDPDSPGRVCYGGCHYNKVLSIITPNAQPDAIDIDYAHGAALLLRAEAFRGADVFADHYFLFFEELELAERVRARGGQIGFCPGFRVAHYEGASRRQAAGDFFPEVAEYFENLGALRFTRDHYPWLLPTVLLFRGPGKFIVLSLRGERGRLAFWALALADFFRRRVRRFPFQAGWQPRLEKDRLVDSEWPDRVMRRRAG